MLSRNAYCWIAASLALVIGCAPSGPAGPKPTPVTGRVFLDDEALGFGSVVFQPARGGQPARSEIGADGKFTLSTYSDADGALPGKHSVRVLCYATQDPKNKTDKPQGDSLGESLIPVKYTKSATSGLEVLILEGGNAPVILKLVSDPVEEATEEGAEEPVEATEEPAAEAPAEEAVEEAPATPEPTE